MNDADRIKVTPEKKLQHKIWTCNKLASYFGIAKAELRDSVDMYEEVISFPTLADEHRFYSKFYCVHLDPKQISLSILFNGKKIANSVLYEDFLSGESHVHPKHLDEYALSIHITESDVYVMHRADLYDGYGGVFVQVPDDGGFVLEPIANYLKARHPKGDLEPL